MQSPQEAGRPRLLAIDDSPMIHRLLKSRLRSERLEIHSATSSAQGLEAALSLLPDVILVDINLPELDGFGILARLKTNPLTHDIPVIFLSDSADTRSIIRGLELGAIDFVPKPFDVGELKARVRSALRIRLLIKMLAQRAQVDGLTGLWNRAHFDVVLQQEVSSAIRHGKPLALIMADLDRFKAANDTYGHPFGDQVLEEFAGILNSGRDGDVACRYGGEEFAIILPNTTAQEAADVAERYRMMLRSRNWIGAPGLVVTASFGVTDLATVSEPTCKAMIDSADQMLYEAKQTNRDRVLIASDSVPAQARQERASKPAA